MGVSAYRKVHCWKWVEPLVRDAEEVSGVVFVYYFVHNSNCWPLKFLCQFFLFFIMHNLSCFGGFVILLKFSLIKSLCNIKQASDCCNRSLLSNKPGWQLSKRYLLSWWTLHKPGIRFHVLVLQHLLSGVVSKSCFYLFHY